jgi:hypothetical protein
MKPSIENVCTVTLGQEFARDRYIRGPGHIRARACPTRRATSNMKKFISSLRRVARSLVPSKKRRGCLVRQPRPSVAQDLVEAGPTPEVGEGLPARIYGRDGAAGLVDRQPARRPGRGPQREEKARAGCELIQKDGGEPKDKLAAASVARGYPTKRARFENYDAAGQKLPANDSSS